uniref:Uncharacterized protein n=1 Tax=Salix viminalis TaxID=40686 RepID=A0A6N2JZ56_SALVM
MTKNSLDIACPLKLLRVLSWMNVSALLYRCEGKLVKDNEAAVAHLHQWVCLKLTICILTVSIAYAILPALVMDAWFQKEPITMDMKTIRQEKLQYTSVKTRCASGIDHQEGDVMRSTILSE